MRVITGSAKGHKLKSPKDMNIRPTTDRIKETLFNIIANDLDGCKFLDLFGGTGAIGIEALSRGAEKEFFIYKYIDRIKIIDYNLLHTKLSDKAKVYTGDVLSVIRKLGNQKQKFDIIFMDPPYLQGYVPKVLVAIKNACILDGYIIVEHETKDNFELPDGFKIFRQNVYKKTTITFMEVF